MLRLFQSIFGAGAEAGRYPESLVRAAIERAVDGTDPWLRGVSGYRRTLRPAVVHAIDHVVALVDGLAAPLAASSAHYGSDPRLNAFFISAEQLRQVCCRDPALTTLREQVPAATAPVYALLVMEQQERGIFGVERQGEVIVHGVPQVTVSFEAHRMLDPTTDEAETRRLLKRRAFDHLLGLALGRLAAARDAREGLERRRLLLQAKRDLLARGNWGFGTAVGGESVGLEALAAQLAEIEAQQQALGGGDELGAQLEMLADVLARAEEQLWVSSSELVVDRMGIKHSQPAEGAPAFTVQQLHNAAGRTVAVSLVALDGEELRGQG